MRVFNYKLLSGGDMSASINSPVQSLAQMQIGSVQANFTGSPVGSLKLQVSNDDPNVTAAANIIWSDYPASSTAVSAAGTALWNLPSLGFNLLRVVYTVTSGTGTLGVTISGKGP